MDVLAVDRVEPGDTREATAVGQFGESVVETVDLDVAESGVGGALVVVRVDHLDLVLCQHRTHQDLLAAGLGTEVDPGRAVGGHRDWSHSLGQLSVDDLDSGGVERPAQRDARHLVELVAPGTGGVDDQRGVDGLARVGGDPGPPGRPRLAPR